MASTPSRTVDIGQVVSASLSLAKQAGEAIREVQKSGKLNIQVRCEALHQTDAY
jgi:hypothetical protein